MSLTTQTGILAQATVHPTIAVKDIDAARAFYHGTLGLPIVSEEGDGGVRFSAGDSYLHVYPNPNASAPASTVASFETNDLDRDMDALRGAGVTFEEYDLPDLKTQDGVVAFGELRGCWFKDPEGNTLGLFTG